MHELAGGGDSRRRLGRQGEAKPFQQESLVRVGFGVATQDQGAAIGGREVDIEHLDAGELVEHRTRGETRCQRLELCPQGDVQAIGHKGDEDMRFDAAFELMVDGAQLQIVLHEDEGY